MAKRKRRPEAFERHNAGERESEMAKVLNSRHDRVPADAVFVGRKASGMHFGNPFGHRGGLTTVVVASRTEAIQAYEAWLRGEHPEVEPERRQWILGQIPALRGLDLVCFCKPLMCHGDILIRLANEPEPTKPLPAKLPESVVAPVVKAAEPEDSRVKRFRIGFPTDCVRTVEGNAIALLKTFPPSLKVRRFWRDEDGVWMEIELEESK